MNPLVANYGDALWWAVYGCDNGWALNISAITVTGRVLSVVLAGFGHDDVSNIYGICDKPCPKK